MWNNQIILMQIYFSNNTSTSHIKIDTNYKNTKESNRGMEYAVLAQHLVQIFDVMESFCAPICNQNQFSQFPFVAVATLFTIVVNKILLDRKSG
jgi:hypothetical protein